MDWKLLFQAMVKLLSGAVITAAILFLSAGTLDYWNGWLFLGLLFLPMLGGVLFLAARKPELLQKRLHAREGEAVQKKMVLLSGILFSAGFMLGGLQIRFDWPMLPAWVSILSAVPFLAAYGLYGEVLRENEYLSRTIEIQAHQKVIDTGLYGAVRHPMYLATVLMFLCIPLILGSGAAFVLFLAYPFLLAVRIRNEESVLEEGLEGYREYEKKVKYKMIPFLW